MAVMIPREIDSFKTEGEQRFFRFLERVAKPDENYTAWYLPDVGGSEPDFILYCHDVGLVIFEVKDWALEQIEEADPRKFVLRMGHEKRDHRNPLHQARGYFESLLGKMRTERKLVYQRGEHHGKPKLPIQYGVVFPNINKHDYCSRKLNDVIPPNRLFFQDDLHAASDICSDGSGHRFREALLERFPPRFNFKINGAEYDRLKHLLFPVVRVKPPERDTCSYLSILERGSVLDDSQEGIARVCLSGRHLILGPSGSGKTLILVQKAAFLKQYCPQINSILFLCFNITLVNYIKRLLAEKGVGLGHGGVEVCHFFEFCSRVLGEEVQYEKEEKEYYDLVVDETLHRLRSREVPAYDAVLVDEGQDFSAKMAAVVTEIVNAKTGHVAVAIDERQNIYGEGLPWIDQRADSRTRIDEVSRIYRNTVEIRRLALGFIGAKRHASRNKPPDHCEIHGPKPELKEFNDIEGIVSYTAETIKAFHDAKEYPLSEMAILYSRRRLDQSHRRTVPEMLRDALEARGIIANWVAEDYRSKRAYDITTDHVTLSTIHSAKGLDYACVFLIGLDQLGDWMAERMEKLVYVAVTRARHRLFIPYVERTGLIGKLIGCQ